MDIIKQVLSYINNTYNKQETMFQSEEGAWSMALLVLSKISLKIKLNLITETYAS